MQTNLELDQCIWPENPDRPQASIVPRIFQSQAVQKIISDYKSGLSSRQLAVLATGLGKTYTMGLIADYFLKIKKPILVIAHREELLTQAADEFVLAIGNSYKIQIEKADQHADKSSHIVLASVQTIGRGGDRILKFPRNHFGAIFIDEAHHSIGATYQNVINYFCESKETLLVGVTATPSRSDEESLSAIFDSIAIKMDIVAGTKQKYLSPIVSWRVSSQTDLSQVGTTAGDFNLKQLSSTVNNEARNTLIVETYVKRFKGKKALIFATNLEHVYDLKKEFQSIGIKAEAVSGETDKDERNKILNNFKSGDIEVLINFGIYTEGFNYAALDLIIQARPTKSPLLLTQIAGRLTRLFSGKTAGHIVEIIDEHSEKTATVAKIFGFRQEFDCEGHDFLECINKAQSLISEKDYFNPYNCMSWSDMIFRFEKSSVMNPKGFSNVEIKAGLFKIREDIYSEFDPNNSYYDGRYRYYYVGECLKLLHNDKDAGSRYQVIAVPNAIGGYDITLAKKTMDANKNDPSERIISYRGQNAVEAIKRMENYILENYPDWDRLLWINAPWRKRAETEPCSEKQYKIIKDKKLSALPQDQISKNQASDLLSAYFSRM